MEPSTLSDEKTNILVKYLARIEKDINRLLDLRIEELNSTKNILTSKLSYKKFLDKNFNS